MKKNWIEFETMPEYFDFFANIPEDNWTTRTFKDEKGCHCALGHLGVDYNTGVHPFSKSFWDYSIATVPEINDGDRQLLVELGDTPKERILNAIILKESGILDEV